MPESGAVIQGYQHTLPQQATSYRVAPDGSMPTMDWVMQFIFRGYGWHFTVGADITPITGGGAGTVFDAEQPEFLISVPAGYMCVPFDINVAVMPGLQTTDSHVVDIALVADTTQKWNGTGTFTTETPSGLRTDITAGCPFPCASAFTADITTTVPVWSHELARWTGKTDFQGTPADSIIRSAILDYKPLRPKLIVGPAMVVCYFAGSIAVTGYASVNFLALPTTLYSSPQLV